MINLNFSEIQKRNYYFNYLNFCKKKFDLNEFLVFYRSKYFSEGFFPLNSIFNIVIITDSDYKVKNVSGGLIESISTSADLLDSGWFFTSNSNGKIEGRYLFGSDISASNQDLILSILPLYIILI